MILEPVRGRVTLRAGLDLIGRDELAILPYALVYPVALWIGSLLFLRIA